MSKSKGNVINPIEVVEKYGADALRMALIFGASPGSDIALGDDKFRAMRNFANKLWNIGRYLSSQLPAKYSQIPTFSPKLKDLKAEDKKIAKDLDELIESVTKNLNQYRFDFAAEALYHFVWHRFADEYLEASKERTQAKDPAALSTLRHVYLNCLKLLHPLMPFVTEEIWSKIPKKDKKPLIIAPWPK